VRERAQEMERSFVRETERQRACVHEKAIPRERERASERERERARAHEGEGESESESESE